MEIKLRRIFLTDQARALEFYTESLGFVKINDNDLGAFHWLTVGDADNQNLELLLESNARPAALAYQEAIYQEAIYGDGIPATVFYAGYGFLCR